MLGCKGLMFGHFENDTISTIATIRRTSKNCFQGYDVVRGFLWAKYR